MYCGACLHDNTLAAAMRSHGHQVELVPIYTPTRTDETDVSAKQVFFGAINVYLKQKSGFFRHTPSILDRLLDRPGLLNWIARRDSTIDPHELGELTLSMIRGERGNQRNELVRMVDWLKETIQPDVVHLSNSLLLGMAHQIKETLGVPVVCAVQGEELFLKDVVEPYKSRVRRELRRRAADADAFVAPSRAYADFMAEFLAVPPERMHQIPLGLNLLGHGEPSRRPETGTLVIGFLARICPEKGLHLLAEAFRRVAERPGAKRVRLRVAGYLGGRDRDYLRGIESEIREWGLEDRFELVGEVDRTEKIRFLREIDVLSVPATYEEPKGLYVLEALANGTPVVEPAHGAFPELMETTGGGILCEPNSVPALAEALASLMDDPGRRAELGRRGREAVHERFSDTIMAERTVELYQWLRE
jgi:glycosyltransferase involved in cell wall biosynthesis